MIHAREDYNRIQDPENKIGQDEPVFLLRATDKCTPKTILFWADLCEKAGNKEMADVARDHVSKMLTWQKENGSKLPDL